MINLTSPIVTEFELFWNFDRVFQSIILSIFHIYIQFLLEDRLPRLGLLESKSNCICKFDSYFGFSFTRIVPTTVLWECLFVQRLTKNVLDFVFAYLIGKKCYLSMFLIYITLIISTVWHLFVYLEVIHFFFSIDPKVSRIQRNEWLMAVFQTGASGKEIREMESMSFCLLHPHGTQTSQLLLPRANLLSDLRGCGGGWEECCFWLEDDEVLGEKAVCPLCALDPN